VKAGREYVENPVEQVLQTVGQDEKTPEGHERDPKAAKKLEKQLAKERAAETKPNGAELQWSTTTASKHLIICPFTAGSVQDGGALNELRTRSHCACTRSDPTGQ
jgi:hypothetical protein